MKLIIGNKRLSSWSLRPWLLLTHFEIPFEEIEIVLDVPTTRSEIAKYSPSGKVPALIDGDLNLWESLAIAEYLNEKYPQKNMWPKDSKDRALARAVSCEMASSFTTMRSHMPHDLKKELKDFDYSKAAADIARVQQIWRTCLEKSKGPFLFGQFSIADAMFTPVVNRFVSYGVKVTDTLCLEYMQTLLNLPAHRRWIEQGKIE